MKSNLLRDWGQWDIDKITDHRAVNTANTNMLLCPAMGASELSMGPFCATRSNPTHQLTDPTQTNPLQVEKFGPNPTQTNTTNQFSSDVFLYTKLLSYF